MERLWLDMLLTGHEPVMIVADNPRSDQWWVGRWVDGPSLSDVIAELRKHGVERAVVFGITIVSDGERFENSKYVVSAVKCCDNLDCRYCSEVKGVKFLFQRRVGRCRDCRYFGEEYGFFPAGWFCNLHLVTVYPDESCRDFEPRAGRVRSR